MSISRLIHHFEAMAEVPVSVADVHARIQALVTGERIELHGVDQPYSQLRGIHHRYHIPALEGSALGPMKVVQIIFSLRQDLPYQRLVCCKEMIHVFDNDPIRTKTREDVVKLGLKLCKKPHFGNLSQTENLQYFFDELAKLQALALLFPFSLREEADPAYRAGRVTDQMLAEKVQLPLEYISSIMSDEWQLLREGILLSC